MPEFNFHLPIELIISVLVYVATWLRNRYQMKKEKQVVYDILQNSGQEEVVRIENVEYRYYEIKKIVEELKTDNALLKSTVLRLQEELKMIVQPNKETDNGIRGDQENSSGH